MTNPSLNRYHRQWEIYGYGTCSFCQKTLELLDKNGERYYWIPINADNKGIVLEALKDRFPYDSQLSVHQTVPIIFLNNTFVGGFSDLQRFFRQNTFG